MRNKSTKFITQAALIGAMYVVITYLINLFGLASGAVQIRISEALTILPLFTPASIPGLLVGCILSNILTGCALWDVSFGSLATLLGALGTYFIGRYCSGKARLLAPVPPIMANTLILPFVISIVYASEDSLPFLFATIFVGEAISCGVFGLILMRILEKYKEQLF